MAALVVESIGAFILFEGWIWWFRPRGFERRLALLPEPPKRALAHFEIGVMNYPEHVTEGVVHGADQDSFADVLNRLEARCAHFNQALVGGLGVRDSPIRDAGGGAIRRRLFD